MLDKLSIAKYRLTLEAEDQLGLPRYKGSTLRGGFGAVFRRMTCAQREIKDCQECLLQATCPYAYIFETPLPEDTEVLSLQKNVPRPFVIEPPLDRKRLYEPGESLEFALILIGKAINYLPYFIVVFRELGRVGVGFRRGKCNLREVVVVQPLDGAGEVIYSGQDDIVGNRDLAVGYQEIEEEARRLKPNRVTLHFLTPTRIKYEGKYVSHPEFHVVLRAILRRLSSLYYFHCGERWETDYRALIEAAKGVRFAEDRTEWVDWERYSKRQRQKMNLGGFVGQASYQGELQLFLPLLVVGELVHVGKACVFGNGQYRIVREADATQASNQEGAKKLDSSPETEDG